MPDLRAQGTKLRVSGAKLRVYVASGGNSITINTIGSQTENTSFAISGTYSGAVPSGMNCLFSIGGGSTTVGGFSASGGAWNGTVTAPNTTGNTTLQVTGTGPNTASATSNSFSLVAAGSQVTTFTLQNAAA